MNATIQPLPIGDTATVLCETQRTVAPNENISPRQASKRLAREWRTIEIMVGIYCRDHHAGGLCPECKGLLDYASVRLDRCRFGTEKPTCAKCRAAYALLDATGQPFRRVRYCQEPLTAVKLAELMGKSDVPPAAFVRTKEPAWKALGAPAEVGPRTRTGQDGSGQRHADFDSAALWLYGAV